MLGLIGKKIGMTRIFDEAGKVTPVTVLQIEDNYVVALRNEEKNGYSACVLGSGLKKKSRVSKPYAGQFPEGVEPTQYLIECRDFDLDANIGDKLTVETFRDIDFVDVILSGGSCPGVFFLYGGETKEFAAGPIKEWLDTFIDAVSNDLEPVGSDAEPKEEEKRVFIKRPSSDDSGEAAQTQEPAAPPAPKRWGRQFN